MIGNNETFNGAGSENQCTEASELANLNARIEALQADIPKAIAGGFSKAAIEMLEQGLQQLQIEREDIKEFFDLDHDQSGIIKHLRDTEKKYSEEVVEIMVGPVRKYRAVSKPGETVFGGPDFMWYVTNKETVEIMPNELDFGRLIEDFDRLAKDVEIVEGVEVEGLEYTFGDRDIKLSVRRKRCDFIETELFKQFAKEVHEAKSKAIKPELNEKQRANILWLESTELANEDVVKVVEVEGKKYWATSRSRYTLLADADSMWVIFNKDGIVVDPKSLNIKQLINNYNGIDIFSIAKPVDVELGSGNKLLASVTKYDMSEGFSRQYFMDEIGKVKQGGF